MPATMKPATAQYDLEAVAKYLDSIGTTAAEECADEVSRAAKALPALTAERDALAERVRVLEEALRTLLPHAAAYCSSSPVAVARISDARAALAAKGRT